MMYRSRLQRRRHWITARQTDLDADRTLPHLHVGERLLQVDLGRVAAGNHVSIAELHGLGTLCANLAFDDHLRRVSAWRERPRDEEGESELIEHSCAQACDAGRRHLSTLGPVLHDVTQNAVASTANSKTLKKSKQSEGDKRVREQFAKRRSRTKGRQKIRTP
jgi:hypothetical protein